MDELTLSPNRSYTPEELDAMETAKLPVLEPLPPNASTAVAASGAPEQTGSTGLIAGEGASSSKNPFLGMGPVKSLDPNRPYTPEELDLYDKSVPKFTPDELDQKLVATVFDDPTYIPTRDEFFQAKETKARLKSEGKMPGLLEYAATGAGQFLQTIGSMGSEILDDPGDFLARGPATGKAIAKKSWRNTNDVTRWIRQANAPLPIGRDEQSGEFVYGTTGRSDEESLAGQQMLAAEQGRTIRQVTAEDLKDEEFDRFVMERSRQKELEEWVAATTDRTHPLVRLFSERDHMEQPMQATSDIVGGFVEATNVATMGIPFGAGAKTLGASRFAKEVGAGSARILERAAARGIEGMEAGAAKFQEIIQKGTRITPENQIQIAKWSAAGGIGGGVFGLDTDVPGLSQAQDAARFIGGAYVGYKLGLGTLRNVQKVAGPTSTILRVAANPAEGFDHIAQASVATKLNAFPELSPVREVLENPTRFRPIESTPARLAADPRLGPQTRAVADALSNPLIVQSVRGASAIAGGAIKGAAANTPFVALALNADEEKAAANMLGLGAGFGGFGGAVNRVTGLQQRRAEARASDTARLFMDVELAGGDVAKLAQTYSPQQLGDLASMQGFFRDKVQFVPLNKADFDTNTQALGGAGAAGLFVQAPPGEKARVFLNLDAQRDGIVPHELGHALLKSGALGNAQADTIRAFTTKRYTQAGVESRAREYATAIIQNENSAKFPGQNLPISDASIRAKMDELGQSGMLRGDIDPLDWARDEIFAEDFRQASQSMDFAAIRRNLPADGSWLGSMENLLGAQANALSISGVRIDPATGQPDPLFKANPILATDPVLKKQLGQYLNNYRDWINHPDQTKARGVRVAPMARAEDLINNPQVTFHDYGGGVMANEFARIDPATGQAVFRDQRDINAETAKRQQQVKSLVGSKLMPATDPNLGPKKTADGRVTVRGRILPQQFDFLNGFAQHQRAFARQFETAAANGESMMTRYHAIGSGDTGAFRIKNLGNLEAITREVIPWGWELSGKGNLLASVLDLTQFRNRAIKAINAGDPTIGRLYNNDLRAIETDLKQWMENHRQDLPGSNKIGEQRRDAINSLIGIATNINKAANPFSGKIAGPGSAIKQFRLDRLDTTTPTGRTGFHFDYDKANGNLFPEVATPLPNLSRDLPGQAMPERIAATAVIDKDGKILSSPLKTHAQLMEESLFNLDKGEFPPTKNFGFVTTEGRFVLQSEAQQIAKQSRQIQGNQPISGEIVSGLEREGLLNPVSNPLDKPVAELNKIMREVGDKMDAGLKLQSYELRDDLPEFQTQAIDDPADFADYVVNDLAPQFPKEFQDRIKSAVKSAPQGQAMPDAVPEFDPQAGAFIVDKGDETSMPVYQQANRGKPAVDNKGEPKFVQTSYDLITAPRIAEYSGPGPEDITKPDFKKFAYDITQKGQQQINAAIDSGAVDNAANSVVRFTQEVMNTPEIAAGMGWYSRMRENLLRVVGEDGREILSQLLGATSAKTPVDENFLQAMDAYEGIKAGRYDSNRKAYLEMLAAEEKNKLKDIIVRRNYVGKVRTMADQFSKQSRQLKGKKKAVYLAEAQKLRDLAKKPPTEWTRQDRIAITMRATDMLPMRSNGKKFNANSMAVLKVISGKWLDNRDSPKTPNFAGNLSGRTVQATIDVWAARFLRETLYEGTGKPWRIQPKSETAVNNQDFALGQVIMARAGKKLGMNPDDLQAVLWFAEKHRWDNRGWTKNQGAEKSSFDTVFNVFFPKDGKPLTFAEASKIFKKSKK